MREPKGVIQYYEELCDESVEDLEVAALSEGRIIDLSEGSDERICSEVTIVPVAGGG